MSTCPFRIATFLALALTATTRAADPAPSANAAADKANRPAQTPVLAENTVLHADVPYGGPDATLDRLDIYAPKDAKSAPVLLFIHGGEWSRGDKHDVSFKPRFLNEHNILFVAANYRLSPKDPHPAQVQDVATAIAFIHKHIAEYGGDPAKLVIMGHSAGCHLVSLVSLNPTYLANVGLTPDTIRGTVAWSGGMYDLPAREKGGGMYPPFIRATFTESEDAQRLASPLTYTKNAAHAPPFLIASCDDEKSATSRAASQQMIDAINASGGHAQSALLVGKIHFTANHELGAPTDTTGQILLDFIHKATR